MQTSSPPADTSYKSNALQNRISQVLAASFADIDIRNALAILDERGVENTPETRRDLQLDIQQELIQCNTEIVHDFGAVADQLKRIGVVIKSLKDSCAELRKHVSAANRESGPMLDEASTIFRDREQVNTKRRLLDAFQHHFVVSEADQAILTTPEDKIDVEFFRVLDRTKKIHHDSQLLLGTEDQRLGLDILEHSSKLLNTAYQNLYRWIQREFKSPDLEDPQVCIAIRRALRVLAERPALFQSCIDLFAHARAETLSNNFLAALTGTSYGDNRPAAGQAIELSAHDPLRYVSDMLAWAHATTVSEREALELLLTSQKEEISVNMRAGIGSARWFGADSIDSELDFDPNQTLVQLIDRDMSGVFLLLKQRIEQVLQSHNEAALAYKLSNLIHFYHSIYSPLMSQDAECLRTLKPLAEMGMSVFTSIMRERVATLQTEIAVSPEDLQPPEFLIDALHELQALMKSYDTSILEPDAAKRAEGFRPVMAVALTPFIEGCETMAKWLQPPRQDIFILNSVLITIESLRKYPFAMQAVDLESKTETCNDRLVANTHEWLVHQAGLQPLLQALRVSASLDKHYLNPSQFASAAEKLDSFLPTAAEDALTYLGELTDRIIARRIIEEAVDLFCGDIERLQTLIEQSDEERISQVNGDAGEEVLLQQVFPRTTDEIRVLLR